MAWAPVGETPIVEISKTRATSHTIIEAISPLGVINVQLKVPKVVVASNSKKRKGPGGAIKKPGKEKGEGWDGNWTLFQLCSWDHTNNESIRRVQRSLFDNGQLSHTQPR